MIILGIDPGSKTIGYGIIQKELASLKLISAGILKISASKLPLSLLEIKNRVQKLIHEFRPDLLAIEKIYFSRNQKTAIAVAEARGIILLAAAEAGLKIVEFSPNEVKAGIAGYGHADKKAILKMVRLVLDHPVPASPDDISDALALAIVATQIRPA